MRNFFSSATESLLNLWIRIIIQNVIIRSCSQHTTANVHVKHVFHKETKKPCSHHVNVVRYKTWPTCVMNTCRATLNYMMKKYMKNIPERMPKE